MNIGWEMYIGYLHSLEVPPHKIISPKGKISNFMMENLGRVHCLSLWGWNNFLSYPTDGPLGVLQSFPIINNLQWIFLYMSPFVFFFGHCFCEVIWLQDPTPITLLRIKMIHSFFFFFLFTEHCSRCFWVWKWIIKQISCCLGACLLVLTRK